MVRAIPTENTEHARNWIFPLRLIFSVIFEFAIAPGYKYWSPIKVVT